MPGTLKVILILAVIVVSIRLRVRLSITLLGASIGVGLFFHLTPTQIAQGFYTGALDPETLNMISKQILVASGAMHSMAGELSKMGMPPVFLVILLPALIGFITGYSPALGGLSLPVLLPFIQSSSVGTFYVMLAVASGLSAHLLSPMHACLVMTLEYYKASIEKTYRMLFAPVAVIFLTGVIVFLLAYGFKR